MAIKLVVGKKMVHSFNLNVKIRFGPSGQCAFWAIHRYSMYSMVHNVDNLARIPLVWWMKCNKIVSCGKPLLWFGLFLKTTDALPNAKV